MRQIAKLINHSSQILEYRIQVISRGSGVSRSDLFICICSYHTQNLPSFVIFVGNHVENRAIDAACAEEYGSEDRRGTEYLIVICVYLLVV